MARPSRKILVGIRLVEALPAVLQGIAGFMKAHMRNWQIQCVDADEFERNRERPGVDGAITVITPMSKKLVDRIRRSNVPTVNMLHDVQPLLPSVLSDDRALGRDGARYFMAHGYAHFAFLGIETQWSADRQRGFTDALGKAGHRSHLSETLFQLADYRSLESGALKVRLRRWAEGLPKPVAAMACSDLAARALLTACEEARLQVPDQVAILGVDNIVAVCELASVPISSVAQDFPKLGFEAARLLDRLMSGRRMPRAAVLIPPGAIAVRRSTDAFAFDDEHVAAAMRIIRQHASKGIVMKQLMSEIAISRKWLDVRFKAVVGHTPSEEIRRVRLAHVQDLLMHTDLSIQQIARNCGFGCGENMIRFFRQACGLPPRQYRLRERGNALKSR